MQYKNAPLTMRLQWFSLWVRASLSIKLKDYLLKYLSNFDILVTML